MNTKTTTPEAANDVGVATNLATLANLHLAASSADCCEGETAKVQSDMSKEELAATDFEPWDVSQCVWSPPTNEQWVRLANPYLVTIRIAWVMLQKTKPELIEVVSNLEGQGMAESTLERLTETEDFLTGLLEVVKVAQARFICAALNVPGEPHNGNDGSEDVREHEWHRRSERYAGGR